MKYPVYAVMAICVISEAVFLSSMEVIHIDRSREDRYKEGFLNIKCVYCTSGNCLSCRMVTNLSDYGNRHSMSLSL